MTRETFEAAVKDIPAGTMVLPAFHGESLLHPDFSYFLLRFKEAGLRISIPASGFAGQRHIAALVGPKSPVYCLIVSLDGYCSHSFSVRRGKIPLAKAEEFALEALRLRGERSSPWIAVRWVDNWQSEKEFELYLKKWLFEKKVDMILRSRMFSYGSKFNSPTELDPRPCRALDEGAPVVLFNGDVLLCERTADREKYVLGNVNEDSLEEILSRRAKMTASYPDCEPCRLCSAAYLLTGFKGQVQLRLPDSPEQEAPIHVHWDHSQTYYSLKKDWSGINWNLLKELKNG